MSKNDLPWFKVWSDLPSHPKTMRLNAQLNERNAHVYFFNLMCWCAVNEPTGDLLFNNLAEATGSIEQACQWFGTPGKLFKAMLDVGFLDQVVRSGISVSGNGKRLIRVHNWREKNFVHFEKATETKAQTAARVRELRKRQKLLALGLVPKEESDEEPPEITEVESGVTRYMPVTSLQNSGSVENLEALSGSLRSPLLRAAKAKTKGKSTFETAAAADPSADFERESRDADAREEETGGGGKENIVVEASPPETDAYGYPIRNCDIAQDFFAGLVERLTLADRQAAHGLFALGLDADVLELGAEDQRHLDWSKEQAATALEAVLRDESPDLRLEWRLAARPPPRPPPSRWTRKQCIRWLQDKANLSGGATEKNLAKFWDEDGAKDVRPLELQEAALAFRGEKKWAEIKWSLARFICEGVWKSRLPAPSC